jgi:methyl-accepting chemotaxis protein
MHKTIKTKLYLYFGLSIIITSVLSSGFFFISYRSELNNSVTEKLKTGASLALNTIDISRLSTVKEPNFGESEYYKNILKSLKDIERIFGLKYIYVLVKENSDYIFVYDTGNFEPEEGVEDTFLTVYKDYPKEIDAAWNTGETKISEYTDQWGSFRSVFLPVKDSSGNVVCTIGVDYSIDKVKAVNRKSYIIFGGIIVFVILIAFIIVARLHIIIIKPIIQIIREVTGISENADLTMRTSVTRSDEIGILSQKFNSFIEKTHGIIQEINGISQRLAASSEEFTSVSETLSQTESGITKEASYTTDTITGLIHKITTHSGEQMELFVILKKLIEDLYSGMKTVSMQSDKTLLLSATVAEHADKGEKSISAMNQSMDNVMKSSTDMIEIIEIINDISDRINLLSLNAAIEAARAGDTGKGFAVVAEEISKLADQTASSTKSIDSLIKANNSEISLQINNLESTISILNLIIGGIENMKVETAAISQVAKAQTVTTELVRSNAGDISRHAEEIKSIAADQKDQLDEITKSISHIDEYTATVTSGAEEISSSSETIADMAEELMRKVSLFKI